MAETAPKKSNVQGMLDRLQSNIASKTDTAAQQKIADLRAKQAEVSKKIPVGAGNARQGGQAWVEMSRLNAEAGALEAAQEKETGRLKEVQKGMEFGASVLGDEGLGRLGTDAKVQETLGRFEDISKQGLSRQEMAAERAQSIRDIDSSTQTSSRAMQAQLARSGVKGAVAGQQLMQTQMQGMQQKADLSQSLFLKSEQIKRQGLKDFSQRLGEVKTFDLGQAAKEKDIEMQAGLGFAQMGSAERTAEMQAKHSKEASIASARASRPSCFLGDTPLIKNDDSLVLFKDLEPGTLLKGNNMVMGVSKHLAIDELYDYNGVSVTGCHYVLDNKKFRQVKNTNSAVKISYRVEDIYVYNIFTSTGLVEIKGMVFADYDDDDIKALDEKICTISEREVQ